MPAKLSPYEAQKRAMNASLRPLEPYPGARYPWRCRCLICKKVVTPRLDNITSRGRGCLYCSGRITDKNGNIVPIVTVVCTINNCIKLQKCKGYCSMHYARWKKGTDMSAPPKTYVLNRSEQCIIGKCEKLQRYIPGYCNVHYRRSKSGIDIDSPIRVTHQARKCHPDRAHAGRGYCRECYRELPDVKRRIKDNNLKHTYGISVEVFEQLYIKQLGNCAACSTSLDLISPRDIHVDHDHRCCSGKKSCGHCVRGLLCRRCNLALGHINDDPKSALGLFVFLLREDDIMEGGYIMGNYKVSVIKRDPSSVIPLISATRGPETEPLNTIQNL